MTRARVKANENLNSNSGKAKKIVKMSLPKPNVQHSKTASSSPIKNEKGRICAVKADRTDRRAEDHGIIPKIDEIKLEEIKRRLKEKGVAASRLNKAEAYNHLIKISTMTGAEMISEQGTIEYGKKKVDELRRMLTQRDISFRKCSKKAELVKLLEDVDGMPTTSDKENDPLGIHGASKGNVYLSKRQAHPGRFARPNDPTKGLSGRVISTGSDPTHTRHTLIQSKLHADVDECSVLPDSYRVITHQTARGRVACDAWLECKLGKSNKFYHLQVLGDETKNSYVVLTRWGPHGSRGQLNYLDTGSLYGALSRFDYIFGTKTGQNWGNLSVKPKKTVGGKETPNYSYIMGHTVTSVSDDQTWRGNKYSKIQFEPFSDHNPFQSGLPPQSLEPPPEGSDSDQFDTPCPTPARKRSAS